MHTQYEAIARAIKYSREFKPYDQYLKRDILIEFLCDILAADNPKFNREKFLEAIK